MAAKKKKINPVKQREKRTKIAAVVGVVLLIAVGAYEVPSMLAVVNKKAPVGTRYDPGPRTSMLPNVSGGATASPAASGQLVNTDVPPQSGVGQLVSFSVFETKNPFTPQVSKTQSASSSPSGVAKAGAGIPSFPTVPATVLTPTTPAGTVVPPTGTAPSATAPTATTATAQPTVAIAVNGAVSRVGRDGTFPTGAPVFRLVSWTKGVAQVGIVGGSYATGAATLTLQVGTPVTLQNQTDGKRYRIELLSTP
jgi:hypothetical protein